MGPVKTAAIKSTIRQIKSSNIMREIRFAPSVPGTISLPLSRFPPTGDYIMGYLVTCIVSDIHNNKNITMHSILDTGSMNLLVIGSGCKNQYCDDEYGIWPINSPGKMDDSCKGESYGSGTAITEFWDSLFNHNIPAKIEVVEDIQNLQGMSHFPSIMGLIPNNKNIGVNNSFVSSVSPTLGANGFTIDLKSDQKTLTLGEINKSGNMVDLPQTSIQGMSTYIYYNVNVKSSSFTPDDGGQPIDIGYTGPAILDSGSTGISMTKAQQAMNSGSGTFTYYLDNGVVLL